MSRGKSLQEMEVKTQQSRTAVNSGAKAGDPMPSMADPGTQLGSVEDLGGPTPENYKPDDDSARLKTPGGTLKQVSDVVNKGAGKADSTPTMKKKKRNSIPKQPSKRTKRSLMRLLPKRKKRPSMLKKTLMLFSVVRNSPKNSRKRQRPSLRLL